MSKHGTATVYNTPSNAIAPLPFTPVSGQPGAMDGIAGEVSQQDILTALSHHPLFSGLNPADFNGIARRMRVVTLSRSELLYRQDTDARHFYFVISGRLRLYRLDPSGMERTLDSITADECIADVMIYAQPPRYACYAEALTQSRLLMIPVKHYRDLLKNSPEYAENVLTHFASQAVSHFYDLEVMTLQSARQRLVRYLLDLLPGQPTNHQHEIELPLPKCLVASRLAMQPETFSRLLSELKNSGLIKVNGTRLLIPDSRRLALLNH
ncbi:Crp/Fnr family transcriptional regulator [Marinobacter sp. 1Y8]